MALMIWGVSCDLILPGIRLHLCGEKQHSKNWGDSTRKYYGDDADLHIRMLLSKCSYSKLSDSRADVFVRRSEEKRITNQLDRALIKSRYERLVQGTHLLKANELESEVLQIWEGQHFVEAEFLLFSQDDYSKEIADVISLWKEDFSPPILRELMVIFYFKISSITKNQAYFVLRIARRVMKGFMPTEYFPTTDRL